MKYNVELHNFVSEKIAEVNKLLRANYDRDNDDLDITLNSISLHQGLDVVVKVNFEASSESAYETVISVIELDYATFKKPISEIYDEIVYLVEENFAASSDPHFD